MYIFDTSSGMLFDKSKGLKWYFCLRFIFFLGLLSALSMAISGPPSFAVSPELYELFPEYVVLFKMAGAFQTFSMFILLVSTIKYRYYMLRWLQIQAIFLLLWYVISYLFLFFQYGIPIDFPVLIAELISIFISYIINYSYLKKRWFSSFSESAKCAEQMPQTNSPLQTPHNSSTICFCRFCGNPLREDSMFCDKCGKKVRS